MFPEGGFIAFGTGSFADHELCLRCSGSSADSVDMFRLRALYFLDDSKARLAALADSGDGLARRNVEERKKKWRAGDPE